jgi:hypothetical protein
MEVAPPVDDAAASTEPGNFDDDARPVRSPGRTSPPAHGPAPIVVLLGVVAVLVLLGAGFIVLAAATRHHEPVPTPAQVVQQDLRKVADIQGAYASDHRAYATDIGALAEYYFTPALGESMTVRVRPTGRTYCLSARKDGVAYYYDSAATPPLSTRPCR